MFISRAPMLSAALVVGVLVFAAGADAANPAAEQKAVAAWRAERIHNLVKPSGWLSLVGLFWLKEGDNTIGREAHNDLVLEQPTLPARVGTLHLSGHTVRFIAAPNTDVRHDGKAVSQIDMASDASEHPTVLTIGSVEFFAIERAGHLGIRVRDSNSFARRHFRGIDSYPVSTAWVMNAKFEPYVPQRTIDIVNILGMKVPMPSPGAVVFKIAGHEYRLDTVLESPDDRELFVMFADATSGRETYGAGRFLYIPLPQHDRVIVDFNKAYNPPCAFSDFATCPLPPKQNRLPIRVTAGEKKYVRPEP